MLPLTLRAKQNLAVVGLLDSGASVNVLPFGVGIHLGFNWDEQTTAVQLTGNLASVEARVVTALAVVGTFPAVRLAFAWAKDDAVPLLLGQVNFFVEFDVCFFRSRTLFEVRPNPSQSGLAEGPVRP